MRRKNGMLYLRDVLLLLSGFVCLPAPSPQFPSQSSSPAFSSHGFLQQGQQLVFSQQPKYFDHQDADRHVAGQCRWLALLTDARRGTQLGGSTHHTNIYESEVIFAAFLSDSYCIQLFSSQLTFTYDKYV